MKYTKKWMVVPFEEPSEEKIETEIDSLDKIIKDESIGDDDKLGLYRIQF